MERIIKYTLIQRIKYTISRNWFCKKRILWFTVPYIASDQDIFIDWIWRDIEVFKLKTKHLNKY
jgi:hypothetical protein